MANDRTAEPATATGCPSVPAFKARDIVWTCAHTHLSPSLIMRVCIKEEMRSFWCWASPSSIASFRLTPVFFELSLCAKGWIYWRRAFSSLMVEGLCRSPSSRWLIQRENVPRRIIATSLCPSRIAWINGVVLPEFRSSSCTMTKLNANGKLSQCTHMKCFVT